MTIIVSIHQPNQELLDMFDNLYVLAGKGVEVYSGHPKYLRKYVEKCGIKCKDRIPIEALLEHCHHDQVISYNKDIQIKCELVHRIEKQGLIEHDKLQSLYKRFSIVDSWTLLKRTFTHTYISQWKILLLQTIIYTIVGIIMKLLFNPEMIEPNGCLEMGFSDLTQNCNQTLEDLNNEYLIKQNMKYIYLISTVLPLYMMVFIIVPFLDEIKVIENQYNNCKLYPKIPWITCGLSIKFC